MFIKARFKPVVTLMRFIFHNRFHSVGESLGIPSPVFLLYCALCVCVCVCVGMGGKGKKGVRGLGAFVGRPAAMQAGLLAITSQVLFARVCSLFWAV